MVVPRHKELRPGTLENRQGAVRRGAHVLESLTERLDFAVSPNEEARELPAADLPRRVFVVHGRDEGWRDRVARTLEKLEFEVEILSEQAHRGRTLIEKFEDQGVEQDSRS